MSTKHIESRDKYDKYLKNALNGFPTDDINSVFYGLFADDIKQINQKRNPGACMAKITTNAISDAGKKINILRINNLKQNEVTAIARQIQQATANLSRKNVGQQSEFTIKPTICGSSLDSNMYDIRLMFPGEKIPTELCGALIKIKKPYMYYRNIMKKTVVISACMLLPLVGVLGPVALLLTPLLLGVTLAPIFVATTVITLSVFATMLAISNAAQLTKKLSPNNYHQGVEAAELAREIKEETQKNLADIDLIATSDAPEERAQPPKQPENVPVLSQRVLCQQVAETVKKYRNCILAALSTDQLKGLATGRCSSGLFTHFNEMRIRNMIRESLSLTDDLILAEVKKCHEDKNGGFAKAPIWLNPQAAIDSADFALEIIQKAIGKIDKQKLREQISNSDIIINPKDPSADLRFRRFLRHVAQVALDKEEITHMPHPLMQYIPSPFMQDAANEKLPTGTARAAHENKTPNTRLQQAEPTLASYQDGLFAKHTNPTFTTAK